jgi:hypothetical protein
VWNGDGEIFFSVFRERGGGVIGVDCVQEVLGSDTVHSQVQLYFTTPNTISSGLVNIANDISSLLNHWLNEVIRSVMSQHAAWYFTQEAYHFS